MTDRTCHVCQGTGTLDEERWKESASRDKSKRAMWAAPYSKKDGAWVYEGSINEELESAYWVIESASFGRCGYQDIEIGLSLTLKQGASGVGWTLYNIGDIAELFAKTNSQKVSDLKGKPVLTYWKKGNAGWGGSIRGMKVAEDLIL